MWFKRPIGSRSIHRGSSSGNRCQIVPDDDSLWIETCRNRSTQRYKYVRKNMCILLAECCELDTDIARNEQHKGLRPSEMWHSVAGFPSNMKEADSWFLRNVCLFQWTLLHIKKDLNLQKYHCENLVCHFALTTEYITFVTGSALFSARVRN
jgi:thermostable 8-oxoguanine DNA glycosylase